MKKIQPNGLPVLIGSLPMDDHDEAVNCVLECTPQIPSWIQLPIYKQEGMTAQFLPGFPGLVTVNDKVFVDTTVDGFDEQLLYFYEEYMAVTEE